MQAAWAPTEAHLVGRELTNWMIALMQRALERRKVDPTLLRYVGTVILVGTMQNFLVNKGASRGPDRAAVKPAT